MCQIRASAKSVNLRGALKSVGRGRRLQLDAPGSGLRRIAASSSLAGKSSFVAVKQPLAAHADRVFALVDQRGDQVRLVVCTVWLALIGIQEWDLCNAGDPANLRPKHVSLSGPKLFSEGDHGAGVVG